MKHRFFQRGTRSKFLAKAGSHSTKLLENSGKYRFISKPFRSKIKRPFTRCIATQFQSRDSNGYQLLFPWLPPMSRRAETDEQLRLTNNPTKYSKKTTHEITNDHRADWLTYFALTASSVRFVSLVIPSWPSSALRNRCSSYSVLSTRS